jgi:hypothetical protein
MEKLLHSLYLFVKGIKAVLLSLFFLGAFILSSTTQSSAQYDLTNIATNEPATVSSMMTEFSAAVGPQTNAVTVFDFEIDHAGAPSDLRFTGVNFHLPTIGGFSWANVITEAQIDDNEGGASVVSTTAITSNQIQFSGISTSNDAPGEVDQNGGGETKTYTLKVIFSTTIPSPEREMIDGVVMTVTVSNTDFTITQDTMNAGTVSSGDSGASNNTIAVTATDLDFTSVPSSVQTSTNFNAILQAQDPNGNRDLDNTATVTLAGSAGTLSSASNLSQSLIAGVYSWSDLQITGAPSFTITGADAPDNLVDGVSSSITVDDTPPATFTTGSVVTTGGTVVATIWNSTNTGVNITVPIDNDASIDGGSLQIIVDVDGGGFGNLGSAATILNANLGGSQAVSITAAQLEALGGFIEGSVVTFNATITDLGANATTGTASSTTLNVDQVSSAAFTTGSAITTGGTISAGDWNSTNTGVNITVPINNDASIDGGSLQIIVDVDGGGFVNLGSAATILNANLGGSQAVSITATQLEALGGFAEGSVITFNATISDINGNPATTGTISTTTLTVDQVAPIAFTTGSVVTTGGTVVASIWNSTNTGVNITVPIDNDASIDGGSLQIIVDVDGGGFGNLGSAATILNANLGGSQAVSITAAQLEALGGFAEGSVITFNATITDINGNSTTGTLSSTTLTVDQVVPAAFTTGSAITTGGTISAGDWNSTNTGVNITVPINNDASIDGGSLQIIVDVDGGGFVNLGSAATILNANLGGSQAVSITAAQLEALGGFAEGSVITFNATISDINGNPATTGTISTTTLTVDQVAPIAFTTGSVVTTGGTVVASIWNSTNTGVNITVPIDNDVSIDGGSLQIIVDVDGGGFGNLGSAATILNANLGGSQAVSITAAQLEALGGFAEGSVITFNATISDINGNPATTGTISTTTLTVDQVAPIAFTTGSVVTTGGTVVASIWNSTNTGVNITVPIDNDASIDGGSLQIIVDVDGGGFGNLGSATTILNANLGGSQAVSITAAQLEALGGFAEGSVITFNATISDINGNPATTGTISTTTLTVDQVAPIAFTTGSVVTTGGTVVASIWNSTNTGVNITVPIDNDASIDGGSLQIIVDVDGGGFGNLGSAATILNANLGGSQAVSITAAQLEALGGFAEGSVITFNATITDINGNSTTGTLSSTTLTVDQVVPAAFTTGSAITTGGTISAGDWNSTNTGVNITVPIDNDASIDGGSLQIIVDVDGGGFGNLGSAATILNANLGGSQAVSITAAQLEALGGFAEGSVITFNATISDINGNPATTGTISTTTLTVDQVAPIAFTTGSVVTTGGTVVASIWNSTNTGVNITVPIDNDASIDGGSLQIIVDVDGGGFGNLGSAATILNANLGGSQAVSITAAQLEALGGFAEGSVITFNATISDINGNPATTGTISTTTLTVDQVAPIAFTTGSVVTTGGTVVASIWNSTNTGVNITVPIDNDASIDGGSLQIIVDVDGGGFGNLGSAATILNANLGGSQAVSITAAQLEALGGFAEGSVITFNATITDINGNSTTGTLSSTTLTVDQVVPAAFTTGSAITTGGTISAGDWNSTNTGVNITVPINNDASIDGGSLQIIVDVDGGGFVNLGSAATILNANLGGSQAVSITAAQLEALGGFAEGSVITFNATISDINGNPATTGTVSSTTLTVDQVAPIAFTTGSVITTGGTVSAGDWNSTNTGVNITVPIANDATIDGGSLQIIADVDGGGFVNLGSAATILNANLGGSQAVSISAAQLEALGGFAEGSVITFNATITDINGNPATTGTVSTTTLTVDQVVPAVFTTGSVVTTGGNVFTTYWNSTNTGVNITIPIANDATIDGGSLQIIADVDGGGFGNLGSAATILNANLGGSQAVSITAAQLEALGGFVETSIISFNAIITDTNGNPSTTGTLSTTTLTVDQTLPTISPDEISIDLSNTIITFAMSEELVLPVGAVTGFSTSNGILSTQLYSGKSTTNTITLNGSGWSSGTTTVSYTETTGNIVDLAGNELDETTVTNHVLVSNPITLSPGDIAITGLNSDSPDDFSFVVLKDLDHDFYGSIKIKFTDNGWTGSALQTGENTITWETTANVFAGTEIKITGTSATIGNITSGSALGTSTSGDQILAYQGTSTSPTFIAGFQIGNEGTQDATTKWHTSASTGSDTNRSALPSGLTYQGQVGANAISLWTGNDNGQYDGTPSNGDVTTLRAALTNTSNWNSNNSAYTLSSGNNFTIPPDLDAVTPVSPANGTTTIANPILTITFNDNVLAGTSTGVGDIKIINVTDGNVLEGSFDIGNAAVTIDGTNVVTIATTSLGGLTHGKTYKVDVAQWVFVNADGNHNTPIVGSTTWSFDVDAVAPTLNPVAITSNNGTSSSQAKVGDVITLTFTSNESLNANPVVTFASGGTTVADVVTVNNLGSNNYSAIYTTQSGDIDGNVTFTINFADAVGNVGTTVTGVTNASAVEFDKTLPILNPVTITSSNAVSPSKAKVGDLVTLEFTASESLSAVPVVSFSSGGVGVAGTIIVTPLGADIYSATYTTQAGDTEGNVTFTIDFIDDAGNNGTQVIAVTDATVVEFDKTAPALVALGITSNNANTSFSTTGNIVTITFETDEPLQLASMDVNSLTTGGVAVAGMTSVAATANPNEYTIKYTVNAADTEGLLAFSITYNDLANNSVIITDADITDLSSVTMDKTAPVVLSILADDANPNNTQSVDYTVTFSDDVTGVDVGDFNVSLANIPVATVANINLISPSQYTVTINTFDLNDAVFSGLLRLNFINTTPVVNNAGLPSASTFFGGTIYTIVHPEPAEDVPLLGFATSNPTNNSIELTWTKSVAVQVPQRYLILARDIDAAGSFASVVDGSFVNDDADLSGPNFNKAISADYVVGIPYTITGLKSGTNYEFTIYPFTNDAGNVDYKTDTPPTVNGATTTANVSTIAAGPLVEPTFVDSFKDSQPQAVQVFDFEYKDDGTGADELLDDAPTRINQIMITKGGKNQVAIWSDEIAGAELSDGTSTITGTVNTNDITFTGINSTDGQLGHIADNGLKTYTLSIWLNSTLTDGVDNTQFDFRILGSNVAFDAGSSTIVGTQNTSSGVSRNIIQVTATQLVWTTQPLPVNIGVLANFSTPPQLTAQDANGNRDLGFNFPVTSVSNTGGITMNNEPTVFSSGILNFPATFSYNDAGDGTLTLTSNAISTPDSDAVAVSYSDNTTVAIGGYVEPVSFSSTTASYIHVADFVITDDVSPSVDDAVPTRISQIVINAENAGINPLTSNWNDLIQDAAIGDGIFYQYASTIGTSTITFSGILNASASDLGYISDNSNRLFALWILLKHPFTGSLPNIIDNNRLVFKVETADILLETQSSTIAPAQSATSGSTSNKIEVIATKLAFNQQPPASNLVNAVFTAIPSIEAIDINGNRDLDYEGAESTILIEDVAPVELFNPAPPTTFTNGELIFPPGFLYTQVAVNTQLRATPQNLYTPAGAILPVVTSNPFSVSTGSGTTITAGTASPATISPLEVTGQTGEVVFNFNINDDDNGAAVENDGNPTLITNLVITKGTTFNDTDLADWRNVIDKAELIDNEGVPNVLEGTVLADKITFSSMPILAGNIGYIANDASKNYSLRIYFKDSLDYRVSNDLANAPTIFVDHKKLEFAILETGISTDPSGTSVALGENSTSGDANQINVDHTELNFFTIEYPSLNTPFSPIVYAQDIKGNTDIDFTEAISTYSNLSTTPASALATSNNPNTSGDSFTAGVYTFPASFQFTEAGVGVTITIETSTYNGGSAAVSNSFNIISSLKSNITLSSSPATNFEYVNFTASDITGAGNAFELARFSINDGGNSGGTDVDGAFTSLDEITFALTNSDNIQSIAIYDGISELDEVPGGASVNLTGLGLQAPDEGSKEFIVYVTFNSANVIDRELQQITITGVVQNGGSKFEFAQAGLTNGNGAGTSGSTNILNVTATKYDFINGPGSIHGINTDFIIRIEARDINDIIDTDYAEVIGLSSEVASINTTGLKITTGFVEIPNFQYTTTGYGTLSVSGTFSTITSGLPNSTDVINTSLQQVTLGVAPNGVALPTRGKNKVLLGIELDARSNTGGEPEFQSITFNSSNDTTNIFENFRLYKQVTPSADPQIGVDIVLVPGAKVNPSMSSPNSIVIDNFHEVLDPTTVTNVYFIVANISSYAYSGTPATSLSVNSLGISNSSGSVTGPGFNGFTYIFKDVQAPTYTLFPANNSISFDPLSQALILTFDEPVIPLDTAFSLFLFSDNSLITKSNVLLDISAKSDASKFSITIPDLIPDTKYYVKFPTGSIADNIGFIDRDDNSVIGIDNTTSWQFRTADNTPPVFVNPPTITNLYNNGFDIQVQLDEPGVVYYMVLTNNTLEPDNASLKSQTPPNILYFVDAGVFDITQGFSDHFISIADLDPNTNYYVYLIPEDAFGNIELGTTGRVNLQQTTTNNSGSSAIVFDAEATVCLGLFQQILDPIHIIEQSNDTFTDTGGAQTLSLILPSGFTFNKNIPPVVSYTMGRDISADPVVTFFSNSVLNIDYTLSGESNIDKITIRNLFVKADASATSGNIIKSGNAIIDGVNFGTALGTLTAVTPSPVTFATNPPASLISVDLPGGIVQLISSLNDGQNIYQGTAVSGNQFNVAFAGVGSHTINLTHIDEFGCQSTYSKTIEVIDNVIEGLNSDYCADNDEITILASERDLYTLIDLQAQTTGISNAGDINSLTPDGNNWKFDPNIASFAGTQQISIDFVGEYELNTDNSIKQTITQRVNVYVVPTVSLTPTNAGDLNNLVDYCEDGAIISIDSSPKPVTGISTGVFTIFDGTGYVAHTGLTDIGDGTAQINPQAIVNDINIDYGDLGVRYVYTNDTSTCVTPAFYTITINEKPTVEIEQVVGCEGEEVILTNSSGGNVINRNWNFDDEGTTFNSTNPLVNTALHTFNNPGSYSITLSIETDKGCVDNNNISPFTLNIGGIPIPAFNYTGVNSADVFNFVNSTIKPGLLSSDTVKTLLWTLDKTNNVQVSLERTNSDNDLLNYNYSNTLIDTVSLTVTTSIGCTATTEKPIAVLDKFDAAVPPANGFDNSTWKIISSIKNSWQLSTNNDNIGQGGNEMWVTNPGVAYLPNEQSYVYSPTFDFSNVSRPLISFDAYWDIATGGALLQFSTDNLNVADPNKVWIRLGELESGEDWYNATEVTLPGISSGIAWSNSSQTWKEPRHVLDGTGPNSIDDRTNVNFRFALLTQDATPKRSGFAFDNFVIGERTRTVLLENFTNTSDATLKPNVTPAISIAKFESDYLEAFAINDVNGTILVKINYHTDFPGKDPVNTANKIDPSARALFYNISKTPTAIIDGKITDAQGRPFSEWGQTSFNLRSLILAQYKIDLNVTTADGVINIEVIPTPQNSSVIGKNTIMLAAILEKNVALGTVPSGQNTAEFVLRKLLPNASGKVINTVGASNGQPMPAVNFSWIPNNNVDPSDLAVVVIIQDETTKEVYQSELWLDVPTPESVTAIEEARNNLFALYPNPANDQLTILLSQDLQSNSTLKIYDNFGKIVFEHAVSETQLILDTQEYASGMYHVQLTNDNEVIRKRLIISHSDR